MPAAPLPSAVPGAQPLQPARRRRRRHGRHGRESTASQLDPRWFTGAIGLFCLGLALLLAWQHPLSAGAAMAGVLLVLLLSRYFWTLWPGWMLGLLPLAGLAPWTGWLAVEEWDLLLLASVAGGYLAISGPWRSPPPPPVSKWKRELRWRNSTLLLLGLFMLAGGMAVLHGLIDAADEPLSLVGGYLDASNTLRAGKPVLALLLMLPLWHRVARRAPQALQPSVQQGLALALLVCVLGVLWEMLPLPNAADWAAGYRAQGPFWEMHVGGAVLDGALALLLPFALLRLLRAEGRRAQAAAALLLALGLAAAWLTLSVGMGLALLLALPATAWLAAAQRRRQQRPQAPPKSTGAVALALAAALLGSLLLAAAALAPAGAGGVRERLQQLDHELLGRVQHARRALAALHHEEGWLIGAGAGRFVPVYAFNAPPAERPGELRWVGGSRPQLELRAPRQPEAPGKGASANPGPPEQLLLTQRLPAARGPLTLRLQVQAEQSMGLRVALCERALRQASGCDSQLLSVSATDGWRALQLRWAEPPAGAARLLSLAPQGAGLGLKLSALSLTDDSGRELLVNGDFSDGLARWFPVAEGSHLPWHAKNLGLHVMFEQGLLGLLLAAALLVLALGRLLLGSAREHPLAPALLGALAGFVLVGLFDSLVDAPRLAFLFLTLLLLALGLRAPPPPLPAALSQPPQA